MQFISFRVLSRRIKAISSMMKDKTVPKRKKLLIVLGIIYLFLPIDLIPPVLFPFGFLDDLVLWIWIIWHLKDTLDQYWVGEKEVDLSRDFKNKDIVEGVEFTVDQEDEEDELHSRHGLAYQRADRRESKRNRRRNSERLRGRRSLPHRSPQRSSSLDGRYDEEYQK